MVASRRDDARLKSDASANATVPTEYTGVPLAPPQGLEVLPFAMGSEEFVLLTFPAPVKRDAIPNAQQLTPSEQAVVELALQGRSNSDIAQLRGTSAHTIANQLSAIYRKLGVRSRRELGARPRSGMWKVR